MIVIIIMIRKKGEKEPKIISSKPSTKIAEDKNFTKSQTDECIPYIFLKSLNIQCHTLL